MGKTIINNGFNSNKDEHEKSVSALNRIKSKFITPKFRYKLENGAIIESNKSLKEIVKIYKQNAIKI